MIGISSADDSCNILTQTLKKLKCEERCDIVITACRKYGKTCQAIESFDSNPIYISKTRNNMILNIVCAMK